MGPARDRRPPPARADPAAGTLARGLPESPILELQRTAGNAAVARILAVQRQPAESGAAVPVNFRMESARTPLPDGGMLVHVRWDSSTAELGDFRSSEAQLREIVRYEALPNPPFTAAFSSSNPLVVELNPLFLPQGRAPDTHVGRRDTVVRAAGTSVAHQVYEFRRNPREGWLPLARFTITRTVYERRGRWFYRVAKSGGLGPTLFVETQL